MPAADRTPVDLAHLRRYTLGNVEADREILTLFRDQAQIYIGRLRAAMAGKAWLEAAHALKGSARGIGAWQLGDAAERAERLPNGPADTQRERALADVEAAHAAVAADIGRILGVLAASKP